METFRWRKRARIVAFVDMLFTGMAMLIVVFAAAFTGAFTAVVTNSTTVKIDDELQGILAMSAGVLWVLVGILAIFTFFQLWAAIKLMNGTDIGRDFSEALKKVTIWRNVTVVFLLFEIFQTVLVGTYICLLVDFLIRGLFLYIVHKFMEELKDKATTVQLPNGIIVNK